METTINTTKVIEPSKEKNEIYDLVNKLNYYTKKYDEGKPEISDQEWDDMYFKLQKLERKTGFYPNESPTQKINYQVVNKLNKVEHNHPMLSLNKTKDIEEVKSFIGNKDYICMAKMDGLTCSLKYKNGKLISAETRGNGLIGEDVLHNALQIKNIPKKISTEEELVIDGEIICTYDNFKNYENEYKNPRNFASGSIRLLDSKESSVRNLTFITWDCIKGLDFEKYLSSKLHILEDLGFTIVPFIINDDFYPNDINKQINEIKEMSKNYPIDGIVFKYDNIFEYNNAGRTDHHFKGGIAYKFYDEEYETKLLDIVYDIGRTGQLTPVAIYEDIDIDGTICSRASLHNQSILKEILHGPGWKGQKITIVKANMIIPQITSAEEDNDGLTKFYIDYPNLCPICGGETVIKKEVDSEILYCGNPQCEGKLVNKIEHFFGKKGLDAKGISKATIGKLIDWEWVTKLSDMFTLQSRKEEWKNIPCFGEKSVSNILSSLQQCCNCNLESIISGAGIPLIGRTVAKDISKVFSSWNSFREACKGNFDFSTLSGFGYEMNKSIKTFDFTELDYIVENYLNIYKEEIKILDELNLPLKNLVFCVTGKVNKFKNRNELTKYIVDCGGSVTGSVSKNTNYLINNDINSTSSKNLRAKELDIPILTEEMFENLVNRLDNI